MHPLALFLLCFLCAAMLLGSRVVAATALIAGACLMTMGQMVVLGPFHLHFVRLIILAGFARTLTKGELFQLNWNRIDSAVVAWLVTMFIATLGRADPGAQFVNALGHAFNTALVYFLFRALVRNVADIVEVGRWLVGVLLILAAAMLLEKASGHSAFEAFGAALTQSRNEKIRAMGPFRHAILAGSVGAALVPLAAALWFRQRAFAVLGVGACVVITVSSASSGPIVALVSGLFALWLWSYRGYRRLIAWTGLASLVLLQVIMDDNVWYLMARVDLVGGSTGWHRAYLIDQAIAHFGEWWLAGTDYTRHWMPTGVSWSTDHSDITNHYLWLGVTGGLGLAVTHICTLALAFTSVGRTLARYADAPMEERFLAWALGSVLFAHTINSLSVAYFDQSVVLVYFTLACLSSLDAYPRSLSVAPSDAPSSADSVAECGRLGPAKMRWSPTAARPTRLRWRRRQKAAASPSEPPLSGGLGSLRRT